MVRWYFQNFMAWIRSSDLDQTKATINCGFFFNHETMGYFSWRQLYILVIFNFVNDYKQANQNFVLRSTHFSCTKTLMLRTLLYFTTIGNATIDKWSNCSTLIKKQTYLICSTSLCYWFVTIYWLEGCGF
jgi:hypothetical protein